MASLHIDGQLYKLEPGKVYLVGGRQTGKRSDQQPDIPLDCTTVEEKHALLDACHDALYLIDLKSATGTYVDGIRTTFTKKRLWSECRVLRFGSVKGKLIHNSNVEEVHDSSGYNDSVRINTSDNTNQSLEDSSPPGGSPTLQRSANSFLIPNTEFKKPERKSDSFIIPETQALMNDSLKSDNNGTVSINSNYDNEADTSDDFCIPETQEVLDLPHNPLSDNLAPALILSPIKEHPPSQLCASQDSELDSGEMIRMCTQDFNVTNEDSRDTTDSDIFLASAIIPYIHHSPVKLDAKEAKLNNDDALNISAINSNNNTLHTKVTKSPDRSGATTPDIFELSHLTNGKEDSNILEERMAAGTPDLFETNDNAIDAPEKNPKPAEVVSKVDERINSCTPDLCDTSIKSVEGHKRQQTIQEGSETIRKPEKFIVPATPPAQKQSAKPPIEMSVEDDDDLMETQPFCVFQQNNVNRSETENTSNPQEERCCTPDLYDFVVPATITKQNASKSNMLTNTSSTCNAQVHAGPTGDCNDEEDDDDLAPTQPYFMFKKTMNEKSVNTNKATSTEQPAHGNKNTTIETFTSKPSTATSVVPENMKQMGDEDDFIATQLFSVSNKSKTINDEQQIASHGLPPGDDDDLIPTQVFQPRHKQLNSTLLAGDANKKSQNANSFFESMETTPQKTLAAAKPFKMPEATPLRSSTSGSSRGSQNSGDIFCTPQTINAIWSQSDNQPQPKAQINNSYLSEDEDDDEERGTFDVLLDKQTSSLSANELENETLKHKQFKLAFNIQTPEALTRKRENRALKRQIKSLRLETTGEPPTKQERKSILNNEKSESRSGASKEKKDIEPESNERTSKKTIDSLEKNKCASVSGASKEKKNIEPGTSKKTLSSLEKKKGKSSSITATELNQKRTLRNRNVDSAKSNDAINNEKFLPGEEKQSKLGDDEFKKAKFKNDNNSKEQKNVQEGTGPSLKMPDPIKQSDSQNKNVTELKKVGKRKSESLIEPSKSSSSLSVSGKEAITVSKTVINRLNASNERNLRSRTKSPASPKQNAKAHATDSKIRIRLEQKRKAEIPEPVKSVRVTKGIKSANQTTDQNLAGSGIASDKHQSNQMPLVPISKRRVTRLYSHINDHVESKEGEPQMEREKTETSKQKRKPKPASVVTSSSKTRDESETVAKNTKERNDSLTSEVYSNNNSEELPKNIPEKSSSVVEAEQSGKDLITATNNRRQTRSTTRTTGSNTKSNASGEVSKKATTSSSGAQKNSVLKDMDIITTEGSKSLKKSAKMKFTTSMVNSEELNAILPEIAEFLFYTKDPLDFDVLLMDKPSRTFKFLVAMASGKPIMHINWLENVKAKKSTQTRSLEHFFVNHEFQRKYEFNFMNSLRLARTQKLFEGYNFLATPNVKPTVQELSVVVGCAGGTFHNKMPVINGSKNKGLYLISIKEDKRHWHQYRRACSKLRIVDVEGVILAVIRQSLTPLEKYDIS